MNFVAFEDLQQGLMLPLLLAPPRMQNGCSSRYVSDQTYESPKILFSIYLDHASIEEFRMLEFF